MEYKRAIVRELSDNYKSCISDHPEHSTIDLERAREQHKVYQKTLEELGIDVIKLSKLTEYPDSCFVEDAVIIHGSKAFLTRFGAESRRGEETLISEILKDYKKIKFATEPATIEGGDFIHLKGRFISGLSKRTNEMGVKQASEWLKIPIDTLDDQNIVHLKSYITYLNDNFIIATKEYVQHPLLQKFNIIEVPEDERYGANTLTIGRTVIMSSKCQKLQKMVKDRGFDVISLKMDQIERCEGALSCLSILF